MGYVLNYRFFLIFCNYYHFIEPFQSDEYSELSTTCSDIDSQPRTPGSALGQDESLNTSTQFDEDEGVFKVPGEPPKTPGREENISRRTRSKLSYTATPIEAMEVPLPPDFKPEIYDTDLDPDESWQEFLKEFQMPLREWLEKDLKKIHIDTFFL